jgi:hypothetical protein
MGEERKLYKVLVGKPEGKRPLGRPRRSWEDGIRMDLSQIGLGVCRLDSTGSGQGPVAGCCECGDEPSDSCSTELVSSFVLQTFIHTVLYLPVHPSVHTTLIKFRVLLPPSIHHSYNCIHNTSFNTLWIHLWPPWCYSVSCKRCTQRLQ